MTFTYLIVEEISTPNKSGDFNFTDRELARFESTDRNPKLFSSKLNVILSDISNISRRKEFAKTIVCKILVEKDQVWSCFIDHTGKFLGDNGPEDN